MLNYPKWYIGRRSSDLLEKMPSLYLNVMRLRWRGSPASQRLIFSETDVVIEGFPRSANSFALAAFRSVNQGGLRIATHVHSPAQVLYAVENDIPAMVLIREPDEAILSLGAYAVQLDKLEAQDVLGRGSGLFIRYWLKRYCSFYLQLLPVLSCVYVAHFEEVVDDFGQVTREFNQKFGTNFNEFTHTANHVDEIFSRARVHLHPSREREEFKRCYSEIYYSEENELLRRKANELYQRILSEIIR